MAVDLTELLPSALVVPPLSSAVNDVAYLTAGDDPAEVDDDDDDDDDEDDEDEDEDDLVAELGEDDDDDDEDEDEEIEDEDA